MKKLILSLGASIILLGCKELKPKKEYTVRVATESKAIIGGGTDKDEMVNVFKAISDEEAYDKGIMYYAALVNIYNETEGNTYAPRPTSFSIENELGLDITPSISKEIKDSISKAVFASIIDDKSKIKNGKLVVNEMLNPYLDTTGDGESPVKIISARFVEKEYSSYKDVRLFYKNVSGKKIDAIRFMWYGTNSFNEPAEAGSYTDPGLGGGFMDYGLGKGESNASTWNILSKDGKKIKRAWVTEVAFHDGTKWEHK